MRRIGYTPFSVLRMAGVALALVVAFALVWATAAHAQMDDQYGPRTSPQGAGSGQTMCMTNDEEGVIGVGDTLAFEGDFSIAPGASVVLQDADGTQGTLVDGENAEFSEGSLNVSLTGDPINVHGGDGVLNTSGGCLSVASTTGVAGDSENPSTSDSSSTSHSSSSHSSSSHSSNSHSSNSHESHDPAISVLPDTGGAPPGTDAPLLAVALGGLALAGAGIVMLRLHARRR